MFLEPDFLFLLFKFNFNNVTYILNIINKKINRIKSFNKFELMPHAHK